MSTELLEKSAAEVQAATLADQVKALVIRTNEDRTSAEQMIQGAKQLEDEIFAYLDPPRAKAYEDYKYHKQRLDDALKPVQEARKVAKQKCISWDTEQERIRREEERRLEEEARKRAEEEALAMAAQAEAEGDKEAAEAIIEAPLDVAPVVVPKTSPAPSRLTAGREIWSAEEVSLILLVKAVAAGQQPISLLQANMTAINGLAKALKKNFNVPGFKAIARKV